jgi:hypothetical protein
MRKRMLIVASVLSGLLVVPLTSLAQMPERKPGTMGVPSAPSVPGMPSVPSVPPAPSVPAVPSKDVLLKQTNGVVTDLTSLKNSGKLAADQAKQVDTLLPKAQSMAGELAKPQLEATRLPQIASELKSLQQQVTTLKGLVGR